MFYVGFGLQLESELQQWHGCCMWKFQWIPWRIKFFQNKKAGDLVGGIIIAIVWLVWLKNPQGSINNIEIFLLARMAVSNVDLQCREGFFRLWFKCGFNIFHWGLFQTFFRPLLKLVIWRIPSQLWHWALVADYWCDARTRLPLNKSPARMIMILTFDAAGF